MGVETSPLQECPRYDVVIVGGGLSGLTVARYVHRSNQRHCHRPSGPRPRNLRWKLLEASPRLGGRLQNDHDDDDDNQAPSHKIDLGGAWIWPQHQPAIVRTLVASPTLGIQTFLQPGEEYVTSQTTRIVNGAVEFVHRIYQELRVPVTDNYDDDDDGCEGAPFPKETNVQLECAVTSLTKQSDGTISVELENGDTVRTSYAVLAVPPRILSAKVTFRPDLPEIKSAAMAASETWMAGVTKVALIYDKGQGQAQRQRQRQNQQSPPPIQWNTSVWSLLVREGRRLLPPGKGRPAFQVYDGSPVSSPREDQGEHTMPIAVLTFFTLASLGRDRGEEDRALANDCAEQMVHSLSASVVQKVPNIANYIRSYDTFCVKRWPLEPYISHDTDPTGITPHPEPVAELAKSEWDGTLLFAGTETDQHSPGVMEGAVGAATRVVRELAQKIPEMSFE